MSEPADALPGLIRTVRASVEEHVPGAGPIGEVRFGLIFLLLNAEIMAEGLLTLMKLAGVTTPGRPPQQIHAPLADNAPLAPRRDGEPRA
jgi:hypothetical protein